MVGTEFMAGTNIMAGTDCNALRSLLSVAQRPVIGAPPRPSTRPCRSAWTMCCLLSCCILLPATFVLAADEKAVIEGVVTYTGPILKPVPVPDVNGERQLIEVQAKTNGLKDAVVWLEGVKAAEKP